jgi:hypothetical protein
MASLFTAFLKTYLMRWRFTTANGSVNRREGSNGLNGAKRLNDWSDLNGKSHFHITICRVRSRLAVKASAAGSLTEEL